MALKPRAIMELQPNSLESLNHSLRDPQNLRILGRICDFEASKKNNRC